ncbi:uncharacterized protein HD556DRAFT_1479395 [Suillus plorans]|uniref:Uncharacterized protein n=1 Tax=Suillus plorans TaxID=116603 RepID=A0A9P7ANT5_9AGAM|nr:uncharacterized protein HD556DRAFT_1479395 [Suillus plorans]KAG1793292.1 hypothetical protein HD556DRAFT_1479395 [Suillus plorans]
MQNSSNSSSPPAAAVPSAVIPTSTRTPYSPCTLSTANTNISSQMPQTSTLALTLTGYNKAAYGDEESTEELTFEVDSDPRIVTSMKLDAYGGLGDVTGIWEESREEAFKYFTSLEHNGEYAAAYTSLGIYYSEHASPPDSTRASKCFQETFELDARESEAARRPAEGFADEREWDLVEVVARRTIDGEGGMVNAWAWKALSVVELVKDVLMTFISNLTLFGTDKEELFGMFFQAALRADVDDQLSWLRLGEAYSKANRHVAVLRALSRAHELEPDDWMCTYFIAKVQRQAGRLAEALTSFQSILDVRPAKAGVLLSELSFISRVNVVSVAIRESLGYRGVAWKIAADALLSLPTITTSQQALPKPLGATCVYQGDTKNAAKIGLLYLYHNDVNLATQAFTKAQTLDPGYTMTWMAKHYEVDVRTLLEHAVSMTADVPMADLQFDLRVLVTINDSNTVRAPTTDRLLTPFFFLGCHSKRCPADACDLHIFLFANSPKNLNRDYEGSLASFENALGLLPEDVERESLIWSASFKMGDLQAVMAAFQAALESVADDRVLRGQRFQVN